MTKQEWHLKHGFDDEDMARIELVVRIFKGKVTKIVDMDMRIK